MGVRNGTTGAISIQLYHWQAVSFRYAVSAHGISILVAPAVDFVVFCAVENRLCWLFSEKLECTTCGYSALGAVKRNCNREQ